MRPNLKRCILILRDIPEDTSREEVEALFDGEGLPEVKGRVEYAINSNWYVRFDSESDAYTAYQFVINKTFNGRPIHVCCCCCCVVVVVVVYSSLFIA